MQPADLDQARLAGAQLAARTAHHLLNAPLTLALGYSDLVAEDPRVPPELRVLAAEASDSIQTAAAFLRRLMGIRRLVERDIGLPSGPVLELSDSTPEAHASASYEDR
jgi:hypothetical protein